ncbi:phosphatidylinositol kinase [Flexivirga endophytica]|uniref:Phosphatidylinositol kinase n=1 Tax=Flexivirga endophytica TaxID=1849103 RepID=A0A916WVD7_9MICO|nr:SCO1664 family protein [Flexivirga endophytica]GGB35654.1 phosphatidylinositol kinase [Flexivirga endophytica]GHB43389.1 phosphatidylinositol kinase [Flexivirga endophytica]
MPTAIDAERLQRLLSDGPLEVEGRLVQASNFVLRVWVEDGGERIPAVYKPIRGEQPLWDFPEGTLAGRESAAYLIAAAGQWDCVPVTALRPDGPMGAGSVQQWVGPLEPVAENDLLRIDPLEAVPSDYLPVLGVHDEEDRPLVVSHAPHQDLRDVALLDVVLNNADRKASSLILDDGHLYAVDHGLTLHAEEKLRTVLWGFAGEPLSECEIGRLESVRVALANALGEALRGAIQEDELEALRDRVEELLETRQFPEPPDHRHPLPWPLW